MLLLCEPLEGTAGGEGAFATVAPPPGSAAVYVAVQDADALHDRIVAAGGEIALPLQDTDYGSRCCR